MPNRTIRQITVNSETFDIVPKAGTATEVPERETLFLRGDGTWTTTPGQEIFVSTAEPSDTSAKLWLRT